MARDNLLSTAILQCSQSYRRRDPKRGRTPQSKIIPSLQHSCGSRLPARELTTLLTVLPKQCLQLAYVRIKNEYWFSTPLPKRHSPEILTPQWDFVSMLDEFWNGDYDLIAIRPQATRYALEFNPHGYPFGGIGSLVALVECFGDRVVGVDDGTGYEKYVPRTNIWKPRAGRVV